MINIFRILHILSATLVLSLLPISLILLSRIKQMKGTPAELITMGNLGFIGKTMGMIGGLGLLISGGALVGMESYKWFSFSDFPWLAIKQTIFVVILIINLGFVAPASKKMGKLIGERLATGGSGGATDEIRGLARKIGSLARIMDILGLIALVLGASKGVF